MTTLISEWLAQWRWDRLGTSCKFFSTQTTNIFRWVTFRGQVLTFYSGKESLSHYTDVWSPQHLGIWVGGKWRRKPLPLPKKGKVPLDGCSFPKSLPLPMRSIRTPASPLLIPADREQLMDSLLVRSDTVAGAGSRASTAGPLVTLKGLVADWLTRSSCGDGEGDSTLAGSDTSGWFFLWSSSTAGEAWDEDWGLGLKRASRPCSVSG